MGKKMRTSKKILTKAFHLCNVLLFNYSGVLEWISCCIAMCNTLHAFFCRNILLFHFLLPFSTSVLLVDNAEKVQMSTVTMRM